MVLDHQRETQFNRDGQLRERKLQDELRKLKAFMVLSATAPMGRVNMVDADNAPEPRSFRPGAD